MNWKRELGAGVFLIVTLTVLGLAGYAAHQRNLRIDAEAKLISTDLKLAGANAALAVKPKDVAPAATPAAVKAAIKKGTVTPIAGVTGKAISNVVTIPCPEPVHSSMIEDLNVGVPTQETPYVSASENAVQATFDVSGNLFIGQIKHGEAIWTGGLSGTAHVGEFSAPITFDPDKMDVQVKVSEDIGKAVDYYQRGWFKKHTALVCPGVGVTYNPLDAARPVNVGITCTYGFSWF